MGEDEEEDDLGLTTPPLPLPAIHSGELPLPDGDYADLLLLEKLDRLEAAPNTPENMAARNHIIKLLEKSLEKEEITVSRKTFARNLFCSLCFHWATAMLQVPVVTSRPVPPPLAASAPSGSLQPQVHLSAVCPMRLCSRLCFPSHRMSPRCCKARCGRLLRAPVGTSYPSTPSLSSRQIQRRPWTVLSLPSSGSCTLRRETRRRERLRRERRGRERSP